MTANYQIISLPWPPSMNEYWHRSRNGGIRISDSGKAFRVGVSEAALENRLQTMTGRLAVEIQVYVPDRRRRDLDNLLKPTLDALQHAGAYEDDSQIDDLRIVRAGYEPPDGNIVIRIAGVMEPQA